MKIVDPVSTMKMIVKSVLVVHAFITRQKVRAMSKFVTNRSCEMCNKIEVGLTEIQVGKSKHFLCYPCMAIFASDVFEFARLNLAKHEDDFGNIYFTDKGEINV